MAIKSRLIKLAKRRALHLPRGRSFGVYAANRLAFYRAKKRRRLELPHPTSLMIELTNHCQLKCVICARETEMGEQMDKGHMDLGSFKKLIDEAHVYLDRIGLTGLGETLLYPHLKEALRYIRSKNQGIVIFVSTNAYQANAPELVEAIADDIDTLQISLDGIGSVFESIRKKSDYNKYYANLEAISELVRGRGAAVKCNMVVFKQNYEQMPDVIRLAKRLGIREVYFNIFNLVANAFGLALYDFYKTDAFRQRLAETKRLADELGIYLGHNEFDAPKGFAHCGYPWDDFYITWDGYSVPCCAKPFPKELNFGNVFEDGLAAVINSKAYQEFRRMSRDNHTPVFCERCYKV